jgi:hypothetical protein
MSFIKYSDPEGSLSWIIRIIFDVTASGLTTPQVAGYMKNKGVLIRAFGKTRIRLVTVLGVSPEDVGLTLAMLRKVFR